MKRKKRTRWEKRMKRERWERRGGVGVGVGGGVGGGGGIPFGFVALVDVAPI